MDRFRIYNMTKIKAFGIRKASVINWNVLIVIPPLFFILHSVFSFSISYFYSVLSNALMIRLIQYTYTFRDICIVISLILIVLLRRLKPDAALLTGVLAAVYAFAYLFCQSNIPYLKEIRSLMVLCIVSYIIIRSDLIPLTLLKNSCVRFSRALLILVCLTLLALSDRVHYLNDNYMTFSNALEFPLGFVLYSVYEKNRPWDYALAAVGIYLILMFGARGAFVLSMLFVLMLVFAKVRRKLVLIIGALVLLVIILLFDMLDWQDNIFISLVEGIHSRTSAKLLSGNLFSSRGRVTIISEMLQHVSDDYFIGGGLCADRYYLNGVYAHNFYIEMLVDFGVFGILLSVFVTWYIIRYCLLIRKCNYKLFLMVFFVFSFCQLMMSRSWTTEINLYVFGGLMTSCSRNGGVVYEKGVGAHSNLSQRRYVNSGNRIRACSDV